MRLIYPPTPYAEVKIIAFFVFVHYFCQNKTSFHVGKYIFRSFILLKYENVLLPQTLVAIIYEILVDLQDDKYLFTPHTSTFTRKCKIKPKEEK